MDNKNKTPKRTYPWWTLAAGLVLAAMALLMARRGMGWLPYPVGAAALAFIVIPFLCMRPSWIAVSGTLAGLALMLRFAARGYAWWGYAALFVAALIVLHHFLPTFWWRVVIVLTCVGIAYFCFVESFVIRNVSTDKDPERDYLIVLGAAVYGDQPSLTLVRRLEGAKDYLDKYPDSVAIVSGGMGPGETVSEAQAMRHWLIENGVDEGRIVTEDKATSTMENLQFSFDIIRQRGDNPEDGVAIVSSAYHLYRAKCMAKNLGVEAAGVAAPWGYFFVMLNYFIREAFGVTHLWVFGD